MYASAMSDAPSSPTGLPDRIQQRFAEMQQEINGILAAAYAYRTTVLPDRIAFSIQGAVLDRDILSDYERAQSVSFITRYEHLPTTLEARLAEDAKGAWHIRNLWDLRQALNDYRPIIQNQSDSVFYQNVHNTWFRMLRQQDASKGTMLRVLDVNREDITGVYSPWLAETNKAIRHIISALDYGYLYNGYLQHSDEQLSKRLFTDYTSGELNWLLWKHVMPLGAIKALLVPYHQLMRVLTFPSLGPL
jgi:hypothetical protein